MKKEFVKIIESGNVIRKYDYEKGVITAYEMSDRYHIVKDGDKNRYFAKRDITGDTETCTIKREMEIMGFDIEMSQRVNLTEILQDGMREVKFGRGAVSENEDMMANNRLVALRRAKNRISDYINANIFQSVGKKGEIIYPKFLTLTFKDEITDLKKAHAMYKNFVKRLNYYIKTNGLSDENVKYIAVAEIQPDRAERYGVEVWHYHIVLLNCPYIKFEKYNEIWGHGSVYIEGFVNKRTKQLVHVEVLDGVVKCDSEIINNFGRYMTKTLSYMTKDILNEKLKGENSYLISKNLKKPLEYYIEVEKEKDEEGNVKYKDCPLMEEIKELQVTVKNRYHHDITGWIDYSEYNRSVMACLTEYVNNIFDISALIEHKKLKIREEILENIEVEKVEEEIEEEQRKWTALKKLIIDDTELVGKWKQIQVSIS